MGSNFNIRSKIFMIPLVLASLVATVYLLDIIFKFLSQFGSLFSMFIFAWIISVVLKPLVKYLEKKGVSRIGSIIISFLLLFIVLIGIGIYVFPTLYQELNLLTSNISTTNINLYITTWLENINIRSINPGAEVVQRLNELITYILNNSISFLSNAFNIVLSIALAFFFSFYFLYQGDKLNERIEKIIPPQFRDDYILITNSINQGIQGFIRGQTIIALIGAVVTMIVMKILGLEFILITGIYVLIAMYFPIIGPLIAAILPLLIALTHSSFDFIFLAIFLFLAMQFILNVIGPKVLGKSLGLHPVLVVLAFLIGAQLFGIMGALLALPVAAVIQSLLINYFE